MSLITDQKTIALPDAGRIRVAEQWAQRLGGGPLAFVHKTRDITRPNQAVANRVVGDVKGKDCVLVDDLIDTAGTLVHAAEALVERGGATEVYACATHGVLSGPANERIADSCIKELTFLNTIPPLEGACSKIKYLDVSPIFADAIQRIYEENSMSVLF